MLFPPQIEGYILTGSGDTWNNSKPAARAPAAAASRTDIEAAETPAQAGQAEGQAQGWMTCVAWLGGGKAAKWQLAQPCRALAWKRL
ncbi:type IV secretion protein Rhs [Escherichia coli]|nr:type IV secretion protein Rhs [Escherichia coli]